MEPDVAERLANPNRHARLLQIGAATSALSLAILLTVLAGREHRTPAPVFAQQILLQSVAAALKPTENLSKMSAATKAKQLASARNITPYGELALRVVRER